MSHCCLFALARGLADSSTQIDVILAKRPSIDVDAFTEFGVEEPIQTVGRAGDELPYDALVLACGPWTNRALDATGLAKLPLTVA